jgi:hypothetical protein
LQQGSAQLGQEATIRISLMGGRPLLMLEGDCSLLGLCTGVVLELMISGGRGGEGEGGGGTVSD